MNIRAILLGIAMGIATLAHGQWTLEQCVEYAMANNVSLKQIELQRQKSEIQLNSAQMSRLPNLNANVGQDFSFGRGAGRDGVITDQSNASTGFSVGTSIPVFNGFRINNQVRSGKLNLLAAVEDLNKGKEDLILNISAYYLQVLYNQELWGIAKEQVKLSQEQVEQSEKLVLSGKRSESELYENKAQLAKDKLSETEALNNLQLAKLDLCQLINYFAVDSFSVADVNTDKIAENALLKHPDEAYAYSLENRPAIKAQHYRLESTKKELKIAQADYYPQLNFSASYSTGYYHMFGAENSAFGSQLKDNSREMVGVNLSIPIFNRMQTSNSVKQAKINIFNQELQVESEKQSLRKDIQTAYYNAVAAMQKHKAAVSTVEASELAFKFEQDKYNAGRSTAFDYNTSKLRYEKAQADASQAKFDYIFRTKIFNFYIGEAITLQ